MFCMVSNRPIAAPGEGRSTPAALQAAANGGKDGASGKQGSRDQGGEAEMVDTNRSKTKGKESRERAEEHQRSESHLTWRV